MSVFKHLKVREAVLEVEIHHGTKRKEKDPPVEEIQPLTDWQFGEDLDTGLIQESRRILLGMVYSS